MEDCKKNNLSLGTTGDYENATSGLNKKFTVNDFNDLENMKKELNPILTACREEMLQGDNMNLKDKKMLNLIFDLQASTANKKDDNFGDLSTGINKWVNKNGLLSEEEMKSVLEKQYVVNNWADLEYMKKEMEPVFQSAKYKILDEKSSYYDEEQKELLQSIYNPDPDISEHIKCDEVVKDNHESSSNNSDSDYEYEEGQSSSSEDEKDKEEEKETSKVKKKKSKPYYCRFGMPYFKDKNFYSAPMNKDYKYILSRNHHMFFNIPKVVTWKPKYMVKMTNTIKAHWIDKINEKNKSEIESLKYKMRKIELSMEELNKLKNRVEFLNEKMKEIREYSFMELYKLKKDDPIDWMAIDVKYYENGWYTPDECRRLWQLCMNPSINRESWTEVETANLLTIAQQLEYQNWNEIAQLLGTNRTGYQCFTYFKRIKKSQKDKWTEKEDKLLTNLVTNWTIGGKVIWANVIKEFDYRTSTQIIARWQYVLKPGLKKGRFTDSEEKSIEKGLQEGLSCKEIAEMLGNRSVVQVTDHIRQKKQRKTGAIKNGLWTADEENMLIELVKEYGTKDWVLISGRMKSRNRVQCRLKYNSLMKGKNTTDKEETKKPTEKTKKTTEKTKKTTEKTKKTEKQNKRRKVQEKTKQIRKKQNKKRKVQLQKKKRLSKKREKEEGSPKIKKELESYRFDGNSVYIVEHKGAQESI